MKLGFIDTILAKHTFEEVMDFAAKHNFDNVEIACWPVKSGQEIDKFMSENEGIQESILNYFLGITHIDVHTLTEDKISHIRNYQEKTGVKVSALAYYANPLERGEEKRIMHREHYVKLIEAASKLNVNMITTFIGRDQFRPVEENIDLAVEFWTPIIRYAEEFNVKLAIENCPMYFNKDQWPGGQNLMTTPVIWREMFERIPSNNFGLCYDPSHMVFQHMDPIKPIYAFKDKIFYVHFKDAKIYKEKLDEMGIMAHPLDYTAQKLPGLGDINWSKYVSALTDIGYRGYSSIEIEDQAYDHCQDAIYKSLLISQKYLQQFVIRVDG